MIVPDLNLLVYAYNEDAPLHPAAKVWWERSLSRTEPVGLAWVVLLGFVRLMSSRRVLLEPMLAAEAVSLCKTWVVQPNTRILLPGPMHLDLLSDLVAASSVSANLVTDAHLAVLAIEHQAELHSNDSDFSRFSGLRWRNPVGRAQPSKAHG